MEEHQREEGLAKIKVPAIGVIITGVLGILYGAYSAATFSATMDMQEEIMEQAMEDARQQNPDADTQAAEDMTKSMMEFGEKIGMPFIIAGIIGAAFVAFGGLKMMKGESKGLAVAACIVSFLPVLSPCCLLGLVFGIWGLVAMGKPEVKAVFDGVS